MHQKYMKPEIQVSIPGWEHFSCTVFFRFFPTMIANLIIYLYTKMSSVCQMTDNRRDITPSPWKQRKAVKSIHTGIENR